MHLFFFLSSTLKGAPKIKSHRNKVIQLIPQPPLEGHGHGIIETKPLPFSMYQRAHETWHTAL